MNFSPAGASVSGFFISLLILIKTMETISLEPVNQRYGAHCEVLAVSDLWIVGEGWVEAAPVGSIEHQLR
ncbi:hypothetical protein [Salmonirosea aquatica]|uniref:Uncharacterized protein n=1 Tax=Salmonirosea aquatica TaxID=2654236 RepID=A0A7C9BEW8_9BACT|nr:hypothetical protein [Cytophagaceae bacterium SJW1-29]